MKSFHVDCITCGLPAAKQSKEKKKKTFCAIYVGKGPGKMHVFSIRMSLDLLMRIVLLPNTLPPLINYN